MRYLIYYCIYRKNNGSLLSRGNVVLKIITSDLREEKDIIWKSINSDLYSRDVQIVIKNIMNLED